VTTRFVIDSMLPDKKSTSFTWLQAPRRMVAQAGRPGQREDAHILMDVDEMPSPASTPVQLDKENDMRRGKRMTRMGASSLMRRATSSVRAYQFMEHQHEQLHEEEDCNMEEENGFNDISGSSKASQMNLSIGKKFNKTFKEVKTSIGNLSQRLRRSTRRRYALGETTSVVDLSPTRRILGRTPTKLYSPFGFDSPLNKGAKRGTTPNTPMLSRKMSLATPVRRYSPHNSERITAKSRVGLREVKNSPVGRKSFRF